MGRTVPKWRDGVNLPRLTPRMVLCYIGTIITWYGGITMRAHKMERLKIQIPSATKAKLDALRGQGYTASGYIRQVLERALHDMPAPRRKPR